MNICWCIIMVIIVQLKFRRMNFMISNIKHIELTQTCKNCILFKLYIWGCWVCWKGFSIGFVSFFRFWGRTLNFFGGFNKDLQIKCRKVVKIVLSSISSVRSIAKDILQKPSDFCAFLQKYAKRIIYFALSALIPQEEIMLISWFPFEGFTIS